MGNINPFRIVKMDGRSLGYPNWQYYAEFGMRSHMLFSQSRAWCWETWGPSTEIELMHFSNPEKSFINQHYTWVWNQYKKRIFFRTDLELNLFILKWA